VRTLPSERDHLQGAVRAEAGCHQWLREDSAVLPRELPDVLKPRSKLIKQIFEHLFVFQDTQSVETQDIRRPLPNRQHLAVTEQDG
jgi:hypothetical protein